MPYWARRENPGRRSVGRAIRSPFQSGAHVLRSVATRKKPDVRRSASTPRIDRGLQAHDPVPSATHELADLPQRVTGRPVSSRRMLVQTAAAERRRRSGQCPDRRCRLPVPAPCFPARYARLPRWCQRVPTALRRSSPCVDRDFLRHAVHQITTLDVDRLANAISRRAWRRRTSCLIRSAVDSPINRLWLRRT